MSDIRVTVPPLEDLREAFAKFDTESSGAIPVHALGALLRSVGVVELKEDELQALISEEMFDKNFDLPEFLALMVEIGHTLPAPGTEKKELRKAFKQADGDNDGYLTADELRAFLHDVLFRRLVEGHTSGVGRGAHGGRAAAGEQRRHARPQHEGARQALLVRRRDGARDRMNRAGGIEIQ